MIYENMLSGAFIYSLGVIAGKRIGIEVIDSINFLNQTPYDKPIGDILADWGGKNFIVEFKRNGDEIKGEFSKEHRKKMIAELQSNPELIELSMRCHYIAYGVQNETAVEILFKFYLPSMQERGISNSKFIEKILAPNSKVGISKKEDFIRYLKFLMSFSKVSDIDALLINVSSNGTPIFFKINNYLLLNLSLNNKMENALSQPQNINRTQSKGYGHGR